MKKHQIIKTTFRRFKTFGSLSSVLAMFLFLISSTTFSQSLSIFDLDTSDFPTIKAKFFAFDKDGNQITNLNTSDFDVKENGQPRNVNYVSCPAPKPPQALSSVLVMDASGSMSGVNLNLAKEAAKAWIEALPLGKSECAITAFDTKNYLIQDFTTDKTKLLNGANSLFASGGTSYDAALLNPLAGGLIISNNGKHKRVIVFLSDGMPNYEPRTSEIISEANKQNLTIYSVTLNMRCPQNMKDMSNQTGGQWFENVTTVEQAKQIYQQILQTAQGGDPCEIHWHSGVSCTIGIANVELTLIQNGSKGSTSYQSPNTSVAKLEFNPKSLKFADPQVGVKTEQKVTVTARNANFTVTNITSNNGAFTITPTNFVLISGQSRELTVSYLPADSGYNYCKFEIENDICPTKYYASGGWKGKKPTIRTIKLLHPNGGEVFVAGSDTVITWEGVSPDEPVKLQYSTNNGLKWITIADSAKGHSYTWRVPKTSSNQCLARVTAAAKTASYCGNPDVEICGIIWMGCNLDVETYRDGSPIRHCQTEAEWIDAGNKKEGAWCYYNNDPANGELYGKLYNWYAVNDPRNLAPKGWYLPADDEWAELENCLDSPFAGGKLKSTGTIEDGDGLWISPNRGATNESGFSAVPGGFRDRNGTFHLLGFHCYWWSTMELNVSNAWYRNVMFQNENFGRNSHDKKSGLSIRCVKD